MTFKNGFFLSHVLYAYVLNNDEKCFKLYYLAYTNLHWPCVRCLALSKVLNKHLIISILKDIENLVSFVFNIRDTYKKINLNGIIYAGKIRLRKSGYFVSHLIFGNI